MKSKLLRESDEARWTEACTHLSRIDPVLGKVILRVGACTMSPRKDYFVALCRAIYSQQVSTRVAEVLFGRLKALCPRQRVTPAAVIELLRDELNIKAAGLSRQKAVYVRELAEHFLDKRIPVRKLATMSDDAVIEALVAVKGVGRWTAEMFLMFVLNRPDVWPVDDLGLREGVRDVLGLAERPKPRELIEMGERYRPYRSVATWYFWRRNAGKAPDAKTAEPMTDRAAAAVKAPGKVKSSTPKASARRSKVGRAPRATTRRRSGRARRGS